VPEELLQLIRQKDQEAFRKFFDLYRSRVYNTCLSYLQNAEDAEEITQDVFIEIYNSASSFQGKSSVNTWVYRIAINKCLDKLRFKQRKKRFAFMSSLFHEDTGALKHDNPDFVHPGVALENKESAALILHAIRQLPENQQTVFILRQVEGLSQKEISAIMNTSEKAVESLQQRAKVKLRELLASHYESRGKENKRKDV
jgi:RNA polymerase sigma-70 factor (family 1)